MAVLVNLVVGLGPNLSTQIFKLGESVWPGYAKDLRTDPVAPDCDLEELKRQIAGCPAEDAVVEPKEDDPFAGEDPFAEEEPAADPFIKVGDSVSQGDTLVIIEAMKVMNPIVAEKSGTVTAILVEDAEPVEFNQPLVTIG